jgi:outer membrane cobalamin receptor
MLAALMVLVGVPVIATAQDTPASSPDAPRFEAEIVVTPERGETARTQVPASTVLIDGSALPTLPAVQFGEIVSFLPGFQLQQAQPYSPPPLVSARGFFGGGEAEYVLLLVDGVPRMDAESGLIDWTAVTTSSIRRVEASRGPGASLYGDSAIGGVIQVLTNRAANAGTATLSGGSFGTFVGDGSYARRAGSLGVSLMGSALRTDGASDHAAASRVVFGGGLDGRIRQAAWRWTLSGTENDRDDPGALSEAASHVDPFASDRLFRFDHVDRQDLTTALTLDGGGQRWSHRARVHATVRDDDRIRTILLAPGLGDRAARALSTATVGGSVEGDRALTVARSDLLLRFGIDLSREQLDTTYRAVGETGIAGAVTSQADGSRVRLGGFATSAWNPAARWRVIAGVRWDRINDGFGTEGHDHDAWSPRLGTTVRLSEAGATTLFAQVSKAFKAPTLDQLFDARPYPDFRGGSFTISNPDLVPQRAANLEAGVSGASALRWSALAYRMTVDNEIDFDVRTFSYANIGRSEHTGVEFEAGPNWRRVQPSVSYAFVKVTEPDSDRQLKNVPRHVVTAAAAADLAWGVGAYLRFRHTSGAFLDDENAFAIVGPSTFDLRLRRQVHRQTVFVDVQNLTGHRYQEYGYTLTDFQGVPVAYSYPGAPRAFRAGVILAF